MSRLKRNVVANLAGRFWTALLSLVMVPLYVNILGVEAYGLVGLYATLLAVFSLLDLGFSTTLNRELARLSTEPGRAQEARNLVRTIEVVYWALAGVIAVVMLLVSPVIAQHWVHAQHLSTATVQQAVFAMGLVVALQFPFALYQGGLLGLQRQVELNVLMAVMATAQSGGVLLILWFVSPTIQAFFGWQLLVNALQTILSAILLWRYLPAAAGRLRFRKEALASIWHFAAGVMGITILALILGQLDKIILSTLLPLTAFGYYVLAGNVASQLYAVVYPIFQALFPRFSQLVALGDEPALKRLYHQSCQFLSVAVLPMATILALFAPEVLRLWIRNPAVVANAHLPMTLLVIGTALNGLMNLPYAIMLAYGWTKLPLYQNAIAVILVVPLLLWSASHYGGPGAAAVSIVLNGGYVLIGIQILHMRLLKGEKASWYLRDVGLPLAGALAVAVLGRIVFPTQASTAVTLVWLAGVSALTLAASALAAPFIRWWLWHAFVSRLRPIGRSVGIAKPARIVAVGASVALPEVGRELHDDLRATSNVLTNRQDELPVDLLGGDAVSAPSDRQMHSPIQHSSPGAFPDCGPPRA